MHHHVHSHRFCGSRAAYAAGDGELVRKVYADDRTSGGSRSASLAAPGLVSFACSVQGILRVRRHSVGMEGDLAPRPLHRGFNSERAARDVRNAYSRRLEKRNKPLLSASDIGTSNPGRSGLVLSAFDWLQRSLVPSLFAPDFKALDRGGLVGVVTIRDFVTYSISPWFVGRYGYALAQAKPLPFVPVKGHLSFFT